MTKKEKIALFGGTFDPPHLAHLQVVQYLLQSNGYDEVWVVPSKQNPFKEKGHSFSQRVKMCHLAFDDLDRRVKVREEDKDLSGYTIDLVRQLQKNYPETKFTFVGGSDLREQIPHWKQGDQLEKLVDFRFLPRPPEQDSPFLPLSSTKVRRHLAAGGDPRKFVPEKVAQYIEKEQLYRD